MGKMLFAITKGPEHAGGATRAMQFAAIAAEKGFDVDVILIDEAVFWAQKSIADGMGSTTGERMSDQLDTLVAHNSTLYICAACADKRLLLPDDFVEGCEWAKGPKLVDLMTDPQYDRVLTF
jgi:sulfur relay (sulfurtransferase) complex TusBCD TusD component (DsrE family)